MRRRMIALAAAALLTLAGCDAAFGGGKCRNKDGDRARQEQPVGSSGEFQDG